MTMGCQSSGRPRIDVTLSNDRQLRGRALLGDQPANAARPVSPQKPQDLAAPQAKNVSRGRRPQLLMIKIAQHLRETSLSLMIRTVTLNTSRAVLGECHSKPAEG